MNFQPEIIVVGGGHAGAEAALIAARMGVPTLLVTSLRSAIARMPCNPSIGGLAKSHLVFELDSLGGEMGFNADLTALQEKTLNTSRGPAVQATRAQCDKSEYTLRMQRIIASQANLQVLEDAVVEILTTTPLDASGHANTTGVMTSSHGFIPARAVILTTGTSLRGRIFIGREAMPSGGDGRPAVDRLSASLERLGFKLIRLKTGTPPRLKASSIDFSKTVEHPAEANPPFFSLRTRALARSVSTWKQDACGHIEHVERVENSGYLPLETTRSTRPNATVVNLDSPPAEPVSTWKQDAFNHLELLDRVENGESLPSETACCSARLNAALCASVPLCEKSSRRGGTHIPPSGDNPCTSPSTPTEPVSTWKQDACSHVEHVDRVDNNESLPSEATCSARSTQPNIPVGAIAGSVSTWKQHGAPWPLNEPRMSCWATHTTPESHEIIRSNLGRSALYGGEISGTGVRYCPSIEDKIVRFPDAAGHHVMLEPEDRAGTIIYPNGLSNSLPRDVQERLVHSVPVWSTPSFSPMPMQSNTTA